MTIPYHVYIPSFGEWGFIIGYNKGLHFDFSKYLKIIDLLLKRRLFHLNTFPKICKRLMLRWIIS